MALYNPSPANSRRRLPSRSRRWALIVMGLVLVCISLAALLYLYWPAEPMQLQATLQPTLFISP
jgi:hypothetical protein